MRSTLFLTTALVLALAGPGIALAQQPQNQPPQTGQQAAPNGAQVNVQQRQPEVNVQQPPPEVTVQQPQPEVTVQQAQPEVNVQQQGEPKVTIQQQGEPQVTVKQPGETEVNVQQPDGQNQQAQGQQQGQQTQKPDAARAENMIGKTVRGADGEEVGEIEDLILNPQSGQIERAVIGVGGFLGVGERQVAVDWKQIQPAPQSEDLQTSLTKADVEKMPEFEYGENENAMVGPR